METAHEVVEFSGHIIDSWTLPRAWDLIMDRGGNFDVEEMRVGTTKTETSYARLKIQAPDEDTLERIISELQQLGAVLAHGNGISQQLCNRTVCSLPSSTQRPISPPRFA